MGPETELAGASPLPSVWVVGCGQMAGAFVTRWLQAGLAPGALTLIDPVAPAIVGPAWVPSAEALPAGAPPPDLLFLGIKPQQLASLAPALGHRLAGAPTLIVSMLAGVRTSVLGELFPESAVVRIMPNLPVRIGKGVIALFAPDLPPQSLAGLEALLAAGGTVVALADERQFDAVTALSGSGPAFLFRFIETLAGAGESAGLDAEVAQALALQTVVGAALLAQGAGQPVATLRQQVTSPQGTTEAGLDVLDGDGALSTLLRATVRAAAERSRALALAAEAAADPQGREAVRAAS